MTIDDRIARVETSVRKLAGAGAQPAPRASLSQAMADGSLPLELAALFQIANGLTLDEADIWDLDDTLDYAGRAAIARDYPGAAAFGWNRSDVVLVLDAADTMHCGPGAILAVDSVYPGPESAVLCAPDLGAFLAAATAGHRPWRGVRIIDQQASDLARLIAARPDRVDALLPMPEQERLATIVRREVVPGAELAAYLSIANGLRFARSGLRIAGAGELSPVPGSLGPDGVPGAILIGRAASGEELIVTTPASRRPSDLVLQRRPGGDLQTAPSFGRLLPVLIGWIASDAENAP